MRPTSGACPPLPCLPCPCFHLCVCVCVCVFSLPFPLPDWLLCHAMTCDRPSTPLHVSPPAPGNKVRQRPDSAPPRALHSTHQSSAKASLAIPRRLIPWGEAQRILGADLAGDLVSMHPSSSTSAIPRRLLLSSPGADMTGDLDSLPFSQVDDLNASQPSATVTAGLGGAPSAILTPRLAPRHARPSWPAYSGVAGINCEAPHESTSSLYQY